MVSGTPCVFTRTPVIIRKSFILASYDNIPDVKHDLPDKRPRRGILYPEH